MKERQLSRSPHRAEHWALLDRTQLGAKAPNPFIPNASLSQPAWFLDPSNVTGAASDRNPGDTAARPIVHWAEILRRYGTDNPRLPNSVTYTFLSDQPDARDPVDLSVLQLFGTKPTIVGGFVAQGAAAGVLGAVVVRNRATGQRWTANLGQNVAPLVGSILHDLTVGAFAWILADLGGNVAQLSEPVSAASLGVFFPPPTPIAIAPGQAYEILRPRRVNIRTLLAAPLDSDPFFTNFATLSRVWGFPQSASGPGFDTASIQGCWIVQESRFDRFVACGPLGFGEFGAMVNCFFNGSAGGNNFVFEAGASTSAFSGIRLYATPGPGGAAAGPAMTIGIDMCVDGGIAVVGGAEISVFGVGPSDGASVEGASVVENAGLKVLTTMWQRALPGNTIDVQRGTMRALAPITTSVPNATLLLAGNGGATAATAFNPAGPAWVAPFQPTQANIVANGHAMDAADPQNASIISTATP